MISCKLPAEEMKTVNNYRNSLAEAMFHCALNQRFFKISRSKDPPFFSCSAVADTLVRPVKAYIMTSSCREGRTVGALEVMLAEVLIIYHHCVFFARKYSSLFNCYNIPRLPGCDFMGFQREK